MMFGIENFIVFITTGTGCCLFLALFASFFSTTLRENSHVTKWLLRANAVLFAYLGFSLATARLTVHSGH